MRINLYLIFINTGLSPDKKCGYTIGVSLVLKKELVLMLKNITRKMLKQKKLIKESTGLLITMLVKNQKISVGTDGEKIFMI